MAEPSDEPDLQAIQERLRAFRDDRDWAQFHTPKDLAAAISVEAGELLEIFLWEGPPPNRGGWEKQRDDVRPELADVFIHCLNLADALDIDILAACREKIDLNEVRYPVEKARGSSAKYDQL